MTTEIDTAWDELLDDVAPVPPPPEFAGALDEEMRAGPSAKLPLAMVPMSGGDTDVQPIVSAPIFAPPPKPRRRPPCPPEAEDAVAAPRAVASDRPRRVQVKTGPVAAPQGARARPARRNGARKSYPIVQPSADRKQGVVGPGPAKPAKRLTPTPVKPATERHEIARAKRLGRAALKGATVRAQTVTERAPVVDEEIELDVDDILLTGPSRVVAADHGISEIEIILTTGPNPAVAEDDGIPEIDVSGPYEPVEIDEPFLDDDPLDDEEVEVEEVVTELDIDPSASASMEVPIRRDDTLMIAPPRRFPPVVWAGAAAVAVVAITVALFAGGSEEAPAPEPAAVTIVKAPPVEEAPPDEAVSPVPASSVIPPSVEVEVEVEAEAEADEEVIEVEPEPEPEDQASPRPAATEPPARAAASQAYAAAAQRYAEDRSNEALEIMARAACDLEDGVQARSAFRKLAGRPARKRVYHHCVARDIDLWHSGNTATPEEMLRTAERQLVEGDAAAALESAHKSNLAERSAAAVIVMGAAQCALGSPEKAHALLRHLRPKDRPALLARCKAAGFELEA